MNDATPAAQTRRGRLVLLALAVFFALPVVAGYIVYFFDLAPGASGNYGTLLPTKPLPDATLQDADGRPFKASEMRGKWLMVQFDSGTCDAYCERKLYFMRQVRKALGRDTGRVERLWVITDAASPDPRLVQAIEGTRMARDPGSGFSANFPAQQSRVDHIYVIDPLGNLVMSFPREPNPSRMLKDLQRLLKLSGIG
jgi:cytochrome oxidase Cu insertion factor (SCO1/SenC/PrrC family)